MRSGAKKGIDPKQPSPGTLVRKWAEAAPGGKWRTQTRAALALTLHSVSVPPWFHTSKLAFSICIPGLHPFWSVILALVDSSWLVMANLTEVGAHSHPSHSVTGSTALIRETGRMIWEGCAWVGWPLWGVCSPRVYFLSTVCRACQTPTSSFQPWQQLIHQRVRQKQVVEAEGHFASCSLS